MSKITRGITLNPSELEEQFIRAPGPGGQNVNKVATAVRLRFDVRASSLPPEIRERLLTLAGDRSNRTGEIVIVARRFRTQARNRADARARLMLLIQAALRAPKPRKRTAPSAAAKRRRRSEKQHRSEIKQARRTRIHSD